MNSLRVCIDARLIGGLSGGVEQAVIGLASGLSQLSDGDEEYLFLTDPAESGWIRPYLRGPCSLLNSKPRLFRQWARPAKNGAKALLRFIGNRRVGAMGLPLLRSDSLARSDGTIERAGIDLIHFMLQSAFLTSVPSIYQPWDLQHLHLPQFFSERDRISREIRYRAFCDQAQMVSVASEWGKRDLIRCYGLEEEKVRLVPVAPTLSAYPTPTDRDLSAVRRKFDLPESFVFYPAQTWPHKNHLGLLEALVNVRERHGLAAPAVFSGRLNEFYPKIEERVHKLALVPHIQFLGFVSPLELQCLYKLARCVIFPTLFEGAGMPLFEAFLAGVPVGCSNVTSLPEQAGDAALLFDPSDSAQMSEAIYRLWTDEPLRRELIHRGTERVSRFTWERTARIFRAHYRRIAGRELTDEDRYLMSGSDPRLPRSSTISPMEN